MQELPGHGDRYQFSHALVQQTLLERLSTSRKVRMHGRIGEELEILFGADSGENVAELAYHFSESSSVTGTEKLIKYSRLAGERAPEGYTWEEALSYFQNGLAALFVDLTDSAQAPDEDSAALLFGLGRSQAALLNNDSYASLRRALDYYAASGDLDRVVAIAELPDYAATRNIGLEQLITPALALVPSGSLQAGRLLSRLGQIIGLQEAVYNEAIDSLNQSLEISRREGDLALEVQRLSAITSVYANHMRYNEALESGIRLIELNKNVHDIRSEVSAHYFVATSLIENGDLEGAKSHSSEMLSLAERLGDRFWLEGACWKTEMTLRLSGEWEEARLFAQRARDIGSRQSNILNGQVLIEHETGNHRQGNRYLESLTTIAREGTAGSQFMDLSASARVALTVPMTARITGITDRLDSAISAATHVLEHAESTALSIGQSQAGLAFVAIVTGDPESAAKYYTEMKDWRNAFLFFSISSDRLLGLLAQTMGDLPQASVHFEDALAFCRKGGYQPELAWANHDYAEMLVDRNDEGDSIRISALLKESQNIADALSMRPLIDRIANLQERATAQPRRPSTYPDDLTIREVEVIQLIALGKTDREIADELFISFRTAGNHVRNILNKTSVANRTEAAAYAAMNGLTTENTNSSGSN